MFSGALTIALHVPPISTNFRSIGKGLKDIGEKVREALRVHRKNAFAAESASDFVASSPARETLEFSLEEWALVERVLAEVIAADRPHRSHNVYFNGDQFGIVLEDFDALHERVRKLCYAGDGAT